MTGDEKSSVKEETETGRTEEKGEYSWEYYCSSCRPTGDILKVSVDVLEKTVHFYKC